MLKKKKKSILAAGLVYQPTFAKVVKESSKDLGKFAKGLRSIEDV